MTASWPSLERNLVAILRGVEPQEACPIGRAVFDAGIEAIEVPLNSPEPFRSIQALVGELGERAIVGAGTVLREDEVDRLHEIGGRLMVSPNTDPRVLARAAERSLVTMPGVFTPSEAFQAIAAGASALKFFPANVLGPSGIAAIRAVLPPGLVIAAVGGVSDADFAAYGKVGVRAFGLGGSLYKPGFTAQETARRARIAVEAWDRLFGNEKTAG